MFPPAAPDAFPHLSLKIYTVYIYAHSLQYRNILCTAFCVKVCMFVLYVCKMELRGSKRGEIESHLSTADILIWLSPDPLKLAYSFYSLCISPIFGSLSPVINANFISHLIQVQNKPFLSRQSSETADVSCFAAQGVAEILGGVGLVWLWEVLVRLCLVCGLSGIWQIPMWCCFTRIQHRSFSTR